jgi:outer membrane usher protein
LKWNARELGFGAFLLSGLILGTSAAEMPRLDAPRKERSSPAQHQIDGQTTINATARVDYGHAPIAPKHYTEAWLATRINGVSDGNDVVLLLLEDRDGRVFAPPEAFEKWRMAAPAAKPVAFNGGWYLPLDDVEGLAYRIDQGKQELLLEGQPGIFSASVIGDRAATFSSPATSSLGGFFNYDLQYLHEDDQSGIDGLVEVGLFNGFGVGTSSFLGRELNAGADFIRLESTWAYDWPARMRTVRLGDSINRSGAWGRAVRFGGVQWGTNFATRPGFIPFPLPTIAGEAALPSTVEVFSDNAQRLSEEVPSGPFTISNLPVVTGAGEVTLVVTDLLGREQIISQPYYVSQTLLREGLHDYSYELGFVREDFGLASNDYGRLFAGGTHRLGLTDRFTGELRAELLEDQQTAGAGGSFLWPSIGTANLALAASRQDSGVGGLLSLGFDRIARNSSYGFQTEFTTDDFTQLGLQPGEAAPRQTTVARMGFPITARDSLSLSYLKQDHRGQTDAEFLTMSYGISLPRDFYLSAFALKDLSGGAGDSIGLVLTRPLGSRDTLSASGFWQGTSSGAELSLQRSLPPGRGLGYQLVAGVGEGARDAASVYAQNDVGAYTAEAARLQGSTAYRLGMTGGVAVMGGRGFLTRWLDDSFGVVKVADYADVQIYADNQPVARTNDHGMALVPQLRSFENNRISIEQADLPLDAQLGAVELEATPAFRSGVLVDFPVVSIRGALLEIVLQDGSPLPAGALVRRIDGAERFPVAMRGEVYVTGLEDHNELKAEWSGRTCLVEVDMPAGDDPLPRIGPLECVGVVKAAL